MRKILLSTVLSLMATSAFASSAPTVLTEQSVTKPDRYIVEFKYSGTLHEDALVTSMEIGQGEFKEFSETEEVQFASSIITKEKWYHRLFGLTPKPLVTVATMQKGYSGFVKLDEYMEVDGVNHLSVITKIDLTDIEFTDMPIASDEGYNTVDSHLKFAAPKSFATQNRALIPIDNDGYGCVEHIHHQSEIVSGNTEKSYTFGLCVTKINK